MGVAVSIPAKALDVSLQWSHDRETYGVFIPLDALYLAMGPIKLPHYVVDEILRQEFVAYLRDLLEEIVWGLSGGKPSEWAEPIVARFQQRAATVQLPMQGDAA